MPAEEKTKGGIFIVGTAQEEPLIGEVIAIGKGKRKSNGDREAMWVSVGDKVHYTKNFVNKVMHKGIPHLLMDHRRVLLIIEN